MIKKLKKKFIALATISLSILMIVLVGIMNIINYSSIITETDEILDLLSQQNLPILNRQIMADKRIQDVKDFIPRRMSPEVPFESRYFVVIVAENGTLEEVDTSNIISVDRESVGYYVQNALASQHDRGFINQFRFTKQTAGRVTRILFLDCGRKLDSFHTFLWISLAVGLLGCLIAFIVFLFVAERIVHPIVESYEKQKRFITDAGHEIKTPLTIIGANIDLLESDMGENECLSDVRIQTERLNSLTNNLVYLSKMEEQNVIRKVEFQVSELVEETAKQFLSIAKSKNKVYQINIEPNLNMMGDPDAIRQLVSILIDNAMKYSPNGGVVTLEMNKHKKMLIISVFNTTEVPITNENISHLFDRFYRTDSSRNSETGGHGIGLSIAQAITVAHNGKITAETQNGSDYRVNVVLPLQ